MNSFFDNVLTLSTIDEAFVERPFITQLFFSHLSYFPKDFIYKITKSLGSVKTECFSSSKARGLIVEFEDFVLATFRGTKVRQITDWKTILNFKPTEYIGIPAHRGFVKCLNGLKDPMLDNIRRFDCFNKKVVFTGHSMGGALATLFSLDFPPDEVTTFGSPMVASGTIFRERFQNICYNRLITEHDFVQRLPMQWPWFYEHLGEPIVLPGSSNLRNPLKSHLLTSYLSGLSDKENLLW